MPAPVFTLTPEIVSLAAEISRHTGRFEGLQAPRPQLRLRRVNRARTVQGSTAIEGNTLTLDMVTALLDGKRVLAPRREVLEVQNALAAYELAARLRPWSSQDLLAAHARMMHGLSADAGRYRSRNVGVFRGRKVAHVAPPHALVPRLVRELFRWGRGAGGLPATITASVVHYELEFIHPFTDGNGRIGRLWQHLLLLRSSPVFEFAPVESLVHARQAGYYRALAESGRGGDCTPFIRFSLESIRDALSALLDELRPERETAATRLDVARGAFGSRWFSRRDYLLLHKRLSTATASRDLAGGVGEGFLRRRGSDRTTQYAFAR